MKPILVLLILFFLCQIKNITGIACPKNWMRHRETDRCIYISDNVASFYVAKKYCQSEKAQLAPILTCYDEVELNSILITKGGKCNAGVNCLEYWIGVHDFDGRNAWTTTQGIQIPKNRQFWAPGYPKKNGGRCVAMSYMENKKRGALKNDHCERELKFVCITCPDGFELMPEINECLYLNSKLNSWRNAGRACTKIKKGSQLLTIRNSVKQEAVRRFLQHKFTSQESETCIPADWSRGGKVVWLNGQTANPRHCNSSYAWKPAGEAAIPFSYTNWYPRRPNCYNRDENCALIAVSPEYDYRWEDYTCNSELCSVCEF